MRVLVTGHRGYIGVEMVPVLRAAGHDVVGLDIGLYDELRLRRPARRRPEPLDVDLRDVAARAPRRASTPWSTSPHCRTIRSATSTPSSPTTSTCTRRCGSPRPPRHAGVDAFPVRVVVQPVRRRRRRPARRARRVQSGHAVRRVEGARRAGGEQAGRRRRSRRSTCATPRPTAFAPPARRHRREQPRRPRRHDGQGAAAERRHAVATAGPHPRHHRRLPGRASRRPARRSTTRRSTSARAARTTGSATSPSSSRTSCPAARWRSLPEPRPTPATTASTSRKIETEAPRLQRRAGRCVEAIEELYEAFVSARLWPTTGRARGTTASGLSSRSARVASSTTSFAVSTSNAGTYTSTPRLRGCPSRRVDHTVHSGLHSRLRPGNSSKRRGISAAPGVDRLWRRHPAGPALRRRDGRRRL